jgi:hypothetical protein
MLKTQKFKIVILLSTFYFLFSGDLVEATKLNITSPVQDFGINQEFQADIMLDTEGQSINAIEGKIMFSRNLLELKEIRDGDSIVNLWVERPSLKEDGLIMFSGIIPGGFERMLSPYYEGSQPGKIFSLIFISKGEGEGTVNLENGKVLLHDGKGTEAKTSVQNLFVAIREDIRGDSWVSPRDTEPPEDFKPEIASDPNIFDGKYFLVFAAQDKGSGIDHYEVLEARNKRQGMWKVAESSYVLKDQKLRSFIYVKAIDKAGNERIAVVEPKYPIKWYEQPLIWVIIVIIGIIAYLIWRKFKNK